MRKSMHQGGRNKRKVEEVEQDVPEHQEEENNPAKKPKMAHKKAKKQTPEKSESLPEKVEVTKKKLKRNAKDETMSVEIDSKKPAKSKKKQEVEPQDDGEKEEESPKKKKKTLNTKDNVAANTSEVATEDQEENVKTPSKFDATTMDLTLPSGFPDDWTKEERILLIDQVQNLLPEDDVKDYTRTLKELKWEKVSVLGRSWEESKAEYYGILKKLRKFKTMTEVLSDAKIFIDKDASRSKRPVPPNMQYYIAHRAKYSRTHSDLNMQQLLSKLYQKYENLSAERKKKYIDKYEEEMKAFRGDKLKMNSRRKADIPPKPPVNPMKFYLLEIYKTYPEKSKNSLYIEYKSKWHTLNNEARLKYINMALEKEKKYKEDVEAFCDTHPDYTPNFKSLLTKTEQNIVDRSIGKPMKPPGSGYMIYCKDNYNEFLKYDFTVRTVQISNDWKALPESEREKYAKKAKELKEKYLEDMKKFKEEHPEFEEGSKPKKVKQKKRESETGTNEKSELDVIGGADDD